MTVYERYIKLSVMGLKSRMISFSCEIVLGEIQLIIRSKISHLPSRISLHKGWSQLIDTRTSELGNVLRTPSSISKHAAISKKWSLLV